ncbi:hypothetical protein [Streptomyces sp. WP-1]|uniref:hypothetical protein n=1 Tax=Streptomyces sp. WP-1 TaxID=3041497 RepID=UPI002649E5B6|nr:hypothetical protein [Streptomyces sp. WP-1]WKE70322.1 hypothetical protein QHG49_15360 [Streptomyces sp. WP-1]
MSGDSYYYGDHVTMHGGAGNTGIVKNQGAAQPAPDPALAAALAELRRLIADLRTRVPESSAVLLDESAPAATAEGAVPAQERHRALMAVAGIASMVGTVGQPVAEAVRAVIGMING